MKVIYTFLIAIFVLFIITFSLENYQVVKLKYYDFFDFDLPVYMLIFLGFLSGIIVTGFLGIVERFRLTRTVSKLNKTIRELRRELRAYEEVPQPAIEPSPATAILDSAAEETLYQIR